MQAVVCGTQTTGVFLSRRQTSIDSWRRLRSWNFSLLCGVSCSLASIVSSLWLNCQLSLLINGTYIEAQTTSLHTCSKCSYSIACRKSNNFVFT
ncbi:hypothetical protein BDN70DRAFT_469211 [Pholiota conissans]|uniref:Uncharacterized protein n=1 Tax=Pholiota conissans TaxID=109636 RepID=A0A9P5Z7M9_9AGAR|nr:hypothetical protein BDN70DRAFT_469211 [Pholiota conissans]